MNNNEIKQEEATDDNEAFDINQIPLPFTSDVPVAVNDNEAHASTVQQEVVECEVPEAVPMRSEITRPGQELITEQMLDANRQLERKLERVVALKQQAVRAFRMKEFERAVIFYSKAISLSKDSPMLYNNRAKCYINLKLFTLALEDLKTALRLNPSSLKSGLNLAKIYFVKGNVARYYRAIADVKMHNPEQIDYINEFGGQLQLMRMNRNSL